MIADVRVQPAFAAPAAATTYDRLAEWLLFLPIICVTYLSKIAFPVGETQVSVGIPILLGTVGLGLISGRMRIHAANLSLYLGLVCVLLMMQVLRGNDFSVPSL